MLQDVVQYINSPQVAQYASNNRFVLIMLVIMLIRAKYATYKSMWLSALINIPGTLLHEMSHFVVGLLLNAKPTSFTVLPKRTGEGYYTMGSVGFRNLRFYNACPSAMAPLLLLPIGFWVDAKMLPSLPPTFLNYVLYVLLQTIIIENAIPSRTDFRVAIKSLKGVFFFAIICIGVYFIYNHLK